MIDLSCSPKVTAWRVALSVIAFGLLVLTGQDYAAGQTAQIYGERVRLRWLEGGDDAWYAIDRRGGRREYWLVDTKEKQKQLAFDHQRLAEALQNEGLEASPEQLTLAGLRIAPDQQRLRFTYQGIRFEFDKRNETLRKLTEAAEDIDPLEIELPNTQRNRSGSNGPEVWVIFENRLDEPLGLNWVSRDGSRQTYGKIAPGESRRQHTFAGHIWELVDAAGETVERFQADESGRRAIVDGVIREQRRGQGRRSERRRSREKRYRAEQPSRAQPLTSPTGQHAVYVQEGNLFLVEPGPSAKEGEPVGQPLTNDGTENEGYRRVEWTRDGKQLIAFRVKEAERRMVHLIESSPDKGGRAVLHSRPYALPGDVFNQYTLVVIDVATGDAVEPLSEPIDFGSPRIHWLSAGKRFVLKKVDRGHQRFRLFCIEPSSGQVRTLVDEQADTFIWTTHRDGWDDPMVTWLADSDRAIYLSERSGWRHLYLLDPAASPSHSSTPTAPATYSAIRVPNDEPLRPITSGEFVVRSIERVDEEREQIWFTASGREPDQDPYFIHHYRVNFDGSQLTKLTAGNGTHDVTWSPDRRFLVDRYSRVDLAPVHTLRDGETGELICALEEADIRELEASGWRPPRVFSVPGRDGQTEIWGWVSLPPDFDPNRKYPVLENIYAGPHGSHVPKSFRSGFWYRDLTELGFVVAKIDGMGTANRSKAFHDVCWQNLKDAGFPDRIKWHQAFADAHAWYDLSRVGIYGGSAGGQNATAALLFHGDFYHVAVSGCGCHDNRMDKASWNEQWMGYPVGDQYAASSNIEHAGKLQGELLLIVGEMDRNVPPESTLRLADALIRADKDFDLLVVPGAGHGMGGRYGNRRLREFFVEHLLPERESSQPAAR